MKLIQPHFEILYQRGYTVNHILRFITQVAYTCYKTDKEITDDSAKDFVNKLVRSGHLAMLEHGTVYLAIPRGFFSRIINGDLINRYKENKYSVVNYGEELPTHQAEVLQGVHSPTPYAYITTNLRVIEENQWWGDLDYVCKPTQFHAKRRTVKFVTDRGVSHELVRHRTFSFAQESTRYCNYSKDKFGNELTFIIPTWYEEADEEAKKVFDEFLGVCEDNYLYYINRGFTPQQARQVLPNALKTEIVLTAFESDWIHFFNLRSLGTTGKPHPDMKFLADKVLNSFVEEFHTFKEAFTVINNLTE